MRLVNYVRVSSREQVSGYSLDAQLDICSRWAIDNGHEIVKSFVEYGKSARTDKRPAFQDTISYVMSNDDIRGVLVHKSDRFARNLLDFLTYQNVLEERGKQLFSVCEDFLNDVSHESKFVAKIMGAVSEYISDNIGREAIKGRNQKAKTGSWPGSRPPMGYMRQGKGTGLVPNPQYADQIREAFREFSTGRYTLETWACESYKRGVVSVSGKKIATTTWQQIFRNKLYVGRFDWHEEEIIADHAPLVGENEFSKVQAILSGNGNGKTANRHFWLLAGLLRSQLFGQTMHGTVAKGRYPYYSVKTHYVRSNDVERGVIDLLKRSRGVNDNVPDNLKLALEIAPSLYVVYERLESDLIRRDFLRMVFEDNGLTVSSSGRIIQVNFKQGFDFN